MEHFDAEMLLTIIVGLCEVHFLALTRSEPSKIRNSGLFEIQTGDRSPDRIMQYRQAARMWRVF